VLRTKGLGQKQSLESKNASKDAGVSGLQMDYYLNNTIRWDILLVKGKPRKGVFGRSREMSVANTNGCR
jgi:hypothetical protein